jgi:hypothetical protein
MSARWQRDRRLRVGSRPSPRVAERPNRRIFADAGGPGATLHELSIGNPGRTDTGLHVGGHFDLFAYSVDFAPITLASSTPFWLSIVNDTAADPDDDWLWGVGARAGSIVAFSSSATGPWNSAGGRGVDFQLTGVVPLPPALPLLVTGLLTLFGVSWRRNQAV